MSLLEQLAAFAMPSSFNALQNYNDRSQLQNDLAELQKNQSYQIDPTRYHDPTVRQSAYQQAAVPALQEFAKQYEGITGTSDPRFWGDQANRDEVMKAGLTMPSLTNPVVASNLSAFAKDGDQEMTARAAAQGDPWAAARIASDKDLASSFHLAQQGADIPIKRDQAQQAETRRQGKEDAAELFKQQSSDDQSNFDRSVAGIGGGYTPAQPIRDGITPTGPNVAGGLDYSDAQGNPSKPSVMPYEQARNLILQAAADYPKANAKEALAELEKRYKETYTTPAGQGAQSKLIPAAQNWLGTATNQKEQLQLAANSGDKIAQGIIASMDQRELEMNKSKAEDKRMVIVQNPLPAKMDMNPLSTEEQTALSNAIAERRLDPYRVNSKNQKLLAGAALSHPGLDLNNIAAELGLARNKDIQMKAATAEMLPGLVQKTVEAGKALNYSDAKFVGAVQKWKNGQLNDPKLTKYMTLRNDQLLTIGGVMRANGMTDMAQKLEEEAMHPTLSPKALDAWAEGQLESIDPRLNFYRKATKGNTVIPRANYTPKAGTGYGTNVPASSAAPDIRSAAQAELARRRGGK